VPDRARDADWKPPSYHSRREAGKATGPRRSVRCGPSRRRTRPGTR
jgi:hypothetical protein